MSREEKFWTWFSHNSIRFENINQLEYEDKEIILDEILDKLHEYSDQLFFEIGGLPNQLKELIISAEGVVENFPTVETLVKAAPIIENWEIIAFKPPMGSEFTINYSDVDFKPSEMWFMPLEDSANLSNIGIRVLHKDFDSNKKDNFKMGTYLLLDTILGEKSSAIDIKYLEVNIIPENPSYNGCIELTELQDYINWKKKKYNLLP